MNVLGKESATVQGQTQDSFFSIDDHFYFNRFNNGTTLYSLTQFVNFLYNISEAANATMNATLNNNATAIAINYSNGTSYVVQSSTGSGSMTLA